MAVEHVLGNFLGKPDAILRIPPEPKGFTTLKQRYRGGIKDFFMFYKPEIRKAILQKRKKMNDIAVQQASSQAAAQLLYLPQLIDSHHIAYYLPVEGEMDPRPIIHFEQLQFKKFYLPVIDKNDQKTLAFYSYAEGDTLTENKYGIKEPVTEGKTPIALHELDIVMVPLVSFDKNCNRIGRGAGYYDRTFAEVKQPPSSKPILIGLGYEFQKTPEIVPSPWDVPMDIVITEKNVYKRYT